MSYANVDTIYGRYARGKLWKSSRPRNIPYLDFYASVADAMAECVHRAEASMPGEKPLSQALRLESTKHLSAGPQVARDAYRHILLSEVLWLASGRVEARVTRGFMTRVSNMRVQLTFSQLLHGAPRQVFRVLLPKGSMCCGVLGFYVDICDLTKLTKVERDFTWIAHNDAQVGIGVAAIASTDPQRKPIQPRFPFYGNMNDTLETAIESVMGAAGEPPERHEPVLEPWTEILHAVVMAQTGAVVHALMLDRHRYVVQRPHRPIQVNRYGLPCDPIVYMIGEGLDQLPIEDEDLVNRGRIYDEEGEVLIEWPTPKGPADEPSGSQTGG